MDDNETGYRKLLREVHLDLARLIGLNSGMLSDCNESLNRDNIMLANAKKEGDRYWIRRRMVYAEKEREELKREISQKELLLELVMKEERRIAEGGTRDEV